MAEKKQPPTINTNKLAMSRALGAAFLNHQVEQLEKSVSTGPSSGNWRARRQGQPSNTPQTSQNGPKRFNAPGTRVSNRKQGEDLQATRNNKGQPRDRDGSLNNPNIQRKSSDEEKDEKDADIIVVDASVLVHALYQVKKWCKDGREEIIIIPLEALNTLDLLKKGTTPLAQRARAASRILEAQVGTNPRIRVQQDHAFVLWDEIKFKEAPGVPEIDNGHSNIPLSVSPEWVRRTICCARWEVDNVDAGSDDKPKELTDIRTQGLEVVLAVISSLPDLSPRLQSLKLADPIHETLLAPVPLPAPSISHANKHEPRSSGILVSHWGTRAGIRILYIDPTAMGRGPEDEDRPRRAHAYGGSHTPTSRKPSATDNGRKAGLVERPPAVMAMMEMVAQPSKVVRVLARAERNCRLPLPIPTGERQTAHLHWGSCTPMTGNPGSFRRTGDYIPTWK